MSKDGLLYYLVLLFEDDFSEGTLRNKLLTCE
jgi:hypothetical protein